MLIRDYKPKQSRSWSLEAVRRAAATKGSLLNHLESSLWLPNHKLKSTSNFATSISQYLILYFFSLSFLITAQLSGFPSEMRCRLLGLCQTLKSRQRLFNNFKSLSVGGSPPNSLCYSKKYLFQSAFSPAFLIFSFPATLHCNSPFFLANSFMQTHWPLESQKLAALTEVNLLPETCQEQSLGSKQCEDPFIPRNGQGRYVSTLSEKCCLKFAMPEFNSLLSQLQQLSHFRWCPEHEATSGQCRHFGVGHEHEQSLPLSWENQHTLPTSSQWVRKHVFLLELHAFFLLMHQKSSEQG